jgi:ABC-type transport system involved in multi-copper enzyme maturation permease subunit
MLATLIVFSMIWFRTTDLAALLGATQKLLDVSESTRFAEQFSLALLMAQLAVMSLITPGYAAGSIADEKDRKTWQYLLATDLTNREIILGKFFGRSIFLIGTLAAGLPVIAITALVGGIDPIFIAFGYLFTTTTTLMLAAGGILAAVHAATFRNAIFRSYGLATLYILFGCGIHPFLSPFAILPMLFRIRTDLSYFLIAGFGYVAVQLILTIILLSMAINRMRKVERRSPTLSHSSANRPLARPVNEAARRDSGLRPTLESRPVSARSLDQDREELLRQRSSMPLPMIAERPPVFDDDPFTWKERYTTGHRHTADDESIMSLKAVIGIIAAIVMAFTVIVTLITAAHSPDASRSTVTAVLMVAGAAALFVHWAGLAPAVCGCIIRERTALTLESLLTLPVERRAILEPKWSVNFYRAWWVAGAGIFCTTMSFVVSPLAIVALPVGLLLILANGLLVSLGVWLSCTLSTTVRATMIFMFAAAAVLLIPVTIHWLFTEDGRHFAAILVVILAACCGIISKAFWRFSLRAFDRSGVDLTEKS